MDYRMKNTTHTRRSQVRGLVDGVFVELETIKCKACGKALLKQIALNSSGRCVHCNGQVM